MTTTIPTTCFITPSRDNCYYTIADSISLDDIKAWGNFLRGFGYAVSFRSIMDERDELPMNLVLMLMALRTLRASVSIDGVPMDWKDITAEQYKGIAGILVGNLLKSCTVKKSVVGWRFSRPFRSNSAIEAFMFVCDFRQNDDYYNYEYNRAGWENAVNGDLVHFHSNHVWDDVLKDVLVDYTSEEISNGIAVWESRKEGFLHWEDINPKVAVIYDEEEDAEKVCAAPRFWDVCSWVDHVMAERMENLQDRMSLRCRKALDRIENMTRNGRDKSDRAGFLAAIEDWHSTAEKFQRCFGTRHDGFAREEKIVMAAERLL